MRVRSVATNAELPALLEARMQTFTMRLSYRHSILNSNIFSKIVPTFSFYNRSSMKARVYVSMKPTILDPQGQTICSALNGLGHKEIAAVRQGKYFEISIADQTPRDQAVKTLDEIARDVLSNGVIEDYRVEILG
jgi:phosphoribosylformylglycinamidine synthase subunit PurS